MKAYGMKRKDTCQCCQDPQCIDRKYRHMRGHSKNERKNMEKSRKSAERQRGQKELYLLKGRENVPAIEDNGIRGVWTQVTILSETSEYTGEDV